MNFSRLTKEELRLIDINRLYDLPTRYEDEGFTFSGDEMGNFISVNSRMAGYIGYITKDNGYWGPAEDDFDTELFYLILSFQPSFSNHMKYVRNVKVRGDELPELKTFIPLIKASANEYVADIDLKWGRV